MKPARYEELSILISKAGFIFNTVPALILNNTILSVVSSKAVIIDIVLPPGGTGFDAVKRLRIKALLTPGLSGKVTPKKLVRCWLRYCRGCYWKIWLSANKIVCYI